MRLLSAKGRSKYLLLVHLIFVVKYRKRLLVAYGDEVKQKMYEIAGRSNFEIDTMEVDRDHIHLLVSYEPNISVTQMVRRLKAGTTHDVVASHAYAIASFLEEAHVLVAQLFRLFGRQCVTGNDQELHRHTGMRSAIHPRG